MDPPASTSELVPNPPGLVFRESLKRFMENLDPVDAGWLGQITKTSWEPVFSQLKALNKGNKDSSITRRLLSRVRGFTDSLRPFFGCIDMIMTSNGQIVGIVWGALKVVIEITHKFTEYFSIISDTLETISVELPIFQDYVEKLYIESRTVQKAVVVVFEDILSVFLLVRKVFLNAKGQPRSLFSISVKVFRQEMERIITHLEKHRKNVQVHVDHAERMASKEEREKSTQSRRRLEAKFLSDEKRASELASHQRIEKLLDAPNCWEKHATTIQIYKQPQCWLLNNARYMEWCGQSCGLLWCHGKPGAGKTVLSSVVIDNLQQRYKQDPNITVVYFYCEYDDPDKRQTTKIVASILDQLMYSPKVLALVKETWMKNCPNLQHLGFENLQDLIIQLLKQSQHTYIIVDALDECDHPDDVANILETLAMHACVFVTSRSECEDITTILGRQAQIHVTPEDLQADIEHFVSISLEKHRRISKHSAEIKQHITKVLLSAADGMFLWTTLMIELLANQVTDNGVLSALTQLPIGLAATYHRILTKIDELPSKAWCLRALTWLLCARRPLELSELMTGIAIDDMDASVGWDITRVPSNPSEVIFDCKGLISCTPTLHGIMVQLTHTSVRDFLLTNPVNMASTVPTFHIFPQSKGHALLAKWCLTYLAVNCRTKFGVYQERERSNAPHLKLYTYVKSYWNTHIQESTNPELLPMFNQVISDPEILKSFGGGSLLHVALKYNLEFIVDHLLKTELNLTVLDDQNNSALHLSAINPTWVQLFLAQSLDIHAKNMHGMTPLHMATNIPCLPGKKAKVLATSVTMLIKSGADLGLGDAKGCTPLHLAACSGQLESMMCLIRHQANISAVDATGLTPLHYAAKKGQVGAVKILLDSGADMNSKNCHHLTPVHFISRHGHVQAMQVMIERGADLEAKCLEQMTPLHYAVIHGSTEIVKLLLNQGANVNCSDYDRSTPLHYATAEGNIEIVKCLISHGASLDAVDNRDMLPMHHAAEYGHYQVIKVLVNSGDNINCKTQINWTPLHYAAKHEQLETVMFLIEHGADTAAVVIDEFILTDKLQKDVQTVEQETTVLLIRHGTNINIATINQWTSLHFSLANGKLQSINTLRELGAQLNFLIGNESTALHLAAWHGHLDLCQYLVGKAVNIEDITMNYAPIHLAAWQGNVDVLEFLLTHGGEVNLTNAHEWTPLHLAAWTGSTEAVEFLLESKAQVEAVSKDDNLTAQHLAAWKGNLSTLECLLQAGADINRCCKSGVTPLRLAIQNHQLIAAGFLLDEIGGDIDIGIDIADAYVPNHGYRFPTTPSI